MDYPFEHSDFQGRSMALRTSGFFGAARLVVDGVEIAATKGKFTVHDNQGRTREVKLKTSVLDPVPSVVFDDRTITLVSPLAWYEYAWMSLPVLLVFAGGALGALFGMTAAYSSTRIFRSDRGVMAKYLLSAAASLGAVCAYLASVAAIQLVIAWNTDPASEKALDQIARASNPELPMMVDDYTELVEIEGLEGVLVYHYRLTTVSPGQLSEELLVRRLRPTVAANACDNEAVRVRFLENDVVLRYAYSDAQGGAIGAFDVSIADCL